jgi:hypothetical protein
VNGVKGRDKLRVKREGVRLNKRKRIVRLGLEIDPYNIESRPAVTDASAPGATEKIEYPRFPWPLGRHIDITIIALPHRHNPFRPKVRELELRRLHPLAQGPDMVRDTARHRGRHAKRLVAADETHN